MQEEKNDWTPVKVLFLKTKYPTVCLLLLAYLFLFAAQVTKTAQ